MMSILLTLQEKAYERRILPRVDAHVENNRPEGATRKAGSRFKGKYHAL